MSYLTAQGIPNDSRKAVISIWFRIPESSFAAAKARSATIDEIVAGTAKSYFWGAVPVVTFGPTDVTNEIHPDNQISSSWIGACWNPGPDGSGSDFGLAFHLQFQGTGNTDASDILGGFPEYTSVGITYDGMTFTVYPPLIPVSADSWHHLLISWDLSGSVSTTGVATAGGFPDDLTIGITGTVKIYVALDDKNITGTEKFGSLGGYHGGNGFITENAFLVLGSDRFDPNPTFNWTPTPLPMSPALGLPIADLAEFNPHVELAEFQMFTDVSLDTGDSANRRAFVDEEGKPAPPTQSRELLGKKPEVMLHGSGNWINGNNTGTTGMDEDGNKIDSGQFVPTAKIKKYKPEPQLGR